jgi:hypothetical protein
VDSGSPELADALVVARFNWNADVTTRDLGRVGSNSKEGDGHHEREAEVNTRAKESVADYPRPPAIERVDRHVRALVSGRVIAETRRPIGVLETHHPPVF